MDKIKEAMDQVDMVFDKPEKFKEILTVKEAGNIVDTIIDNLENKIDHVPDQMSGEEHVASVQDELSKDSMSLEEKVAMIKKWLVTEEGTKYQQYFKMMLKKHGYNSPADIPADKKKEFFSKIDKGWKGSKE